MSSQDFEFEKHEDKFQAKFDNLKLPSFSSCIVVSVELLAYRNIRFSFLKDLEFEPDPSYRVICSAVKPAHLRCLITKCLPDNTSDGYVGETFKFVMPKDLSPEQEVLVEIELWDRNYTSDRFLAKESIDVSKIPVDSKEISKVIKFSGSYGELDVKIKKYKKTSYDFRYSVGLSPAEKDFRKKRIPKVFEALKNLLGDRSPQSLMETPVISVVGSGGGYRAAVGMCGAMEAFKDAGLLDTFTYTCGLSGSSWYLTSAYILQGVKETEQLQFHNILKKRMSNSLIQDMVNPSTIKAYVNYLEIDRQIQGQPHTFVNYFPGFLVGKQLLDEHVNDKLSDIIPYVETADVPYPILVALHVKNKMKASDYHAYVERTPHEISLPSYGINLKARDEGSTWSSGVLVRKFPEFPVHFTIGVTGCAFSILPGSFMSNGDEKNESFFEYIKNAKSVGKKIFSNIQYKEKNSSTSTSESESSEVESDNDNYEITEPVSASNKIDESLYNTLMDKFRSLSLFNTRDVIFKRTARLFNFALGLERIERFLLNPFPYFKDKGEAAELLKKIGKEEISHRMSTKSSCLSFVDAGILSNVPTDVMLRPQRTTNVMIVLDFTSYESDKEFNYYPLMNAAKQAWQSGLEFPDISFKEIACMDPTDFLIFPSHGPKCPTVLWFTLSNSQFKKARNYIPKCDVNSEGKENKPFNDFNVFGEDSDFSTFKFQYDNYEFNQLKELMYFNVINHIEEIKDAIADSIKQKRSG